MIERLNTDGSELNKLDDGTKLEEQAKKHALTPEMLDKQWKPGQSGNPSGRPAGKSITAELRKLIEKGTNAEDMARILYEMAKRMSPGQLSAFKELLDRTDGKVPDTHKLESDVPVTIIFKPVEGKDD